MSSSTFGALKNPSAVVQCVGVQGQSGVAAGTGDNTEVTSAGIDTKPTGSPGFSSLVLAFAYKTTLTDTKTISLTVKISDSADNSSWSSDTTLINAEVLLTGSSSTNAVGVRELNVDLSGYKRYVRFKITVDLSHTSADVFVYGATAILCGADRLPV